MLKNRQVIKIISLLIAITLWGYVVWDTNPVIKQTVNKVPVQIRNISSIEERGLVILDEKDYTVDIKVQGKKKDIGKLNVNDISATVDIGGYREGEVTVTVNVQTLDNISVVDISPRKITMHIDKVVEEERAVNVTTDEELPHQSELGECVREFEEVKIKGAKSLVGNVGSVSAVLETSKLTDKEEEYKVRLVPVTSGGEEVKDVSVIPGEMKVSTRLYYVRRVPLSVIVTGEPAEGYRLSAATYPENVLIRGSSEDVTTVRDVKGSVDISGTDKNTVKQIILNLPPGISLSPGEGVPYAVFSVESVSAGPNDSEAQNETDNNGQ